MKSGFWEYAGVGVLFLCIALGASGCEVLEAYAHHIQQMDKAYG